MRGPTGYLRKGECCAGSKTQRGVAWARARWRRVHLWWLEIDSHQYPYEPVRQESALVFQMRLGASLSSPGPPPLTVWTSATPPPWRPFPGPTLWVPVTVTT